MFTIRAARAVILLLLSIPLLATTWWLAAPLFLDTVVEERFPITTPEGRADSMEAGTAAMSGEMESAPSDEMLDEEMEVPSIDEEMAETREPSMEEMGETPMSGEMAEMGETPMGEAPSGPIVLRAGTFRDGDSFHKGSGAATIYRLEDGTRLLRLENFEVTNGPALHVLLVPRRDPASAGEVHESAAVDLGKLKGNRGDQNYELPADLLLEGEWSVVIYCKPFEVIFSVAPLQEAG